MLRSIFACTVLASVPFAQASSQPVGQQAGPATAPVVLATQQVKAGGLHTFASSDAPTGTQAVTATCYLNTSLAGSSAMISAGEEWVDWGVKGCALTGFVGSFRFGYATTAMDPSVGGPGAVIDIALYENTNGNGDPGTQVFRTRFVGLPGSTDGSSVSFIVPVALFTPIRMCQGKIGWGYTGVDGLSGPLLVNTSGTCGGATDPATGTVDCFDAYMAPATAASYVNNFNLGNGITSFYMEVEEHTGASSTSAVFNGTGCNPVLFSELATPRPSQPWITGIDLTNNPTAVATAVVVSIAEITPFKFPFGELLIDVTNTVASDVALGVHQAIMPKAPGLLGTPIFTQGVIVDPIGPGVVLLNGITFTLGL